MNYKITYSGWFLIGFVMALSVPTKITNRSDFRKWVKNDFEIN